MLSFDNLFKNQRKLDISFISTNDDLHDDAVADYFRRTNHDFKLEPLNFKYGVILNFMNFTRILETT